MANSHKEAINAIVLEYLQLNGYDESAQMFQEEAQRKTLSNEHQDNVIQENASSAIKELLRLYDSGERDEFFEKFSTFILNYARNTEMNDEHHRKLEFSLQLHFAVYNLRTHSTASGTSLATDADGGEEDDDDNDDDDDDDNNDDDLMEKFKVYLMTRGSALADHPEFLHYFALPYIRNPSQHVSFKDLFVETWVVDLRKRVEKYLESSVKEKPLPKLVMMYNNAESRNSSALKEISTQLKWERQKLLRLQDNYQKLMHITTELLSALEASVKGDEVNLSRVMDNCLKAFPELFAGGAHVDIMAGPTDDSTSSSLKTSDLNITPIEPERKSTTLLRSKTQDVMLVSLDYRGIKRDLIESSPRLKMLILQALRWRLTQSKQGEQRQLVLASYVAYDLLGMEGGEYTAAIVSLMTSQTLELRQSMARLLNAFASLTAGRSYLASNSNGANRLLYALMDNVRYNMPEAVTLDMSLSTLQKLSLRRQLQSSMINGDLIEYLISVLEDDDALSDYALEYTVALLMNLCLRTAGKERCVRCPRRALNILSNLLRNRNPEILPYVNGTLYSLLTVPRIKSEALTMGLEDMLNCYMQDSSPEMRRQLEFILKQLASEDPVEETTSDYEDEDDDDEEQDVLEDELDKDDVVLLIPGELYGEDLLVANYSLHALKQKQKERQQEDVLTRPATPRIQPASALRRRSSVPSLKSASPYETPSVEQVHETEESSSSPPPPPSSSSTDQQLPTTSQNESQRRTSITPQPTQSRSPTPGANSNINVDQYASRVLTEVIGIEKPVTEAVGFPPVLPREPEKLRGPGVNEYMVAFSSRPKIPRTPEHTGGRRSQSPYPDRSSFREGL